MARGSWLSCVASRRHRARTTAFALTSCVRVYYADPIKARVVDAATGTPVEGVNVLAAWQAKGGLEGGNIMGYVKVMEDVTDANGEFSFPGWGPKVWFNGSHSRWGAAADLAEAWIRGEPRVGEEVRRRVRAVAFEFELDMEEISD